MKTTSAAVRGVGAIDGRRDELGGDRVDDAVDVGRVDEWRRGSRQQDGRQGESDGQRESERRQPRTDDPRRDPIGHRLPAIVRTLSEAPVRRQRAEQG